MKTKPAVKECYNCYPDRGIHAANCPKAQPAAPSHTPTPWNYVNYPHKDFIEIRARRKTCMVSVAEIPKTINSLSTIGSEAEDEANAAFIVKAVNAHEDLIGTLRSIRANLEYQNLDGDKVLKGLWQMADRAIARAEGGK